MQTTTPVHHKSFTFRSFAEWAGGKVATFAVPGKTSICVTIPPEAAGEKDVWTAEELFLGAIETSLLMAFATIVERQELAVDAYYSESTGQLEFDEGQYRFTVVTIRPTIIVPDEECMLPAFNAINRAHRECLIANSLLTTVIVEPDVRLRNAA